LEEADAADHSQRMSASIRLGRESQHRIIGLPCRRHRRKYAGIVTGICFEVRTDRLDDSSELQAKSPCTCSETGQQVSARRQVPRRRPESLEPSSKNWMEL
jgi:hypothetical protein